MEIFTLVYHFSPFSPSLWVGWLVGCFGLNGPLRQYFSLYRAVSQREGGYPVWQHTFVAPSAFSRRAVVSYWRKYVHEVLVNRLGGLSLPRKSVVRLTDRPDMTLDVYRGRKTTNQKKKREREKEKGSDR